MASGMAIALMMFDHNDLSDMDKIRQGSLYGEAAQRIRAMINEGRLEPGIRVPEKQLCEQFGISRTPLREALKVLASEGFVELLPNRGARVVKLTRRMLEDTLDVMSSLEGLSGELACRHVSSEEIETIRALHQKMLEHYQQGDLAAYFDVNRRIHETLVAAARNQVLFDMYQNLNERVRRFRFSAEMTPERWAVVVDEHEQMIDALQDRDGARLGAILRGHLSHKLDFFADDHDDDTELAS
ncbi:GntR family transcriptional regulator [Salinisphaera aquimarina]